MADQPATKESVKAEVEERDIRFIRLWFTDILGQLKSFSVNASELDDAFEGGVGFDGSSITGFNAIEESDMIAMPDVSTFKALPWRPAEQGVARRVGPHPAERPRRHPRLLPLLRSERLDQPPLQLRVVGVELGHHQQHLHAGRAVLAALELHECGSRLRGSGVGENQDIMNQLFESPLIGLR